ncbi:hypothetical protein RND71_026101 [Anisodus tanguticus]|uniref:Uncharacterized protein n=1 Tax=Anisodus tanguticus TaxID=243964 RepID=A0AAE1RMU8_9SOLA|nr:hypothetical protein RND71_026101 [Anisodus tanguticus]
MQQQQLPTAFYSCVFLSEQVKMRAAVQGKDITASDDNLDKEKSWSSTKKEVTSLKEELEKVKMQMTASKGQL